MNEMEIEIVERCDKQYKQAKLDQFQSNQFIKVIITEELKKWAFEKIEQHIKGPRFQDFVNTHKSTKIGYFAEAIFRKKYPIAIHYDKSDFDFLYKDKKIDVKGYWSKYIPKKEYFLQIPTIDIDRISDSYVWINIQSNFSCGYLLGWINFEEFRKIAKLRRRNERRIDISKMEYTTDCYEIQILDLKDMRLL